MEISTQFLVLVPVVLGVVQIAKTSGIPSRFAPLTSLILGVAGTIFLGDFSAASAIQGLIVGLSAAGLWSGVKATIA